MSFISRISSAYSDFASRGVSLSFNDNLMNPNE
jgi:hypothetical protein